MHNLQRMEIADPATCIGLAGSNNYDIAETSERTKEKLKLGGRW